MELLLIWILYSLAKGWGCPYPVLLGWGTPPGSSQIGEHSLPAGYTAVCVSQVASSTAPSSSRACTHMWHRCFSNGLWLEWSRCVTGIRSAFPEPGLPRAQGTPARAEAWPLAVTQALWLQAIPDAQCTQHTKICSAPQGPLALYIFRCVAPSWIHFPSPLTWKRRGRRGMSHAFCTMPPWQQPVTAC